MRKRIEIDSGGLVVDVELPDAKFIMVEPLVSGKNESGINMYEAEAIKKGLADVESGQTIDGNQVIGNIRRKYGIYSER